MGKRGPKGKTREIIWSRLFAYAVGLITTDGCLSGDGRHFSLVSKDVEQLENLKKCLRLEVKIGIHKSGKRFGNGSCHRVQWGDVRLYNFLLSIGLMPNKSRILGALTIPDKYFADFLRGSFDGDGSFYSYFDPRWRSSFMFYTTFNSASEVHVLWLQSTIARLFKVQGHISKVVRNEKGKHSMFSLRYSKREGMILISKMYARPVGIHLARKRLKIERALRIVGKSLPKVSEKH